MSIINIAHRGASGTAPENTLAAFERAAELGAGMIELDVQLSFDGELIVFHDDTLGRCTNVAEVLADRAEEPLHRFAAQDLAKLDAGKVHPEVEGRTGIPTLRQVLEWLEATDGMMLNVELKALPRRPADLAVKTVRAVQALGLESRILFSSFDHSELRTVKDLDPRLRTAVLSAEGIHDLPRYARDFVQANAINPGVHLLGHGSIAQESGAPLDGALIERARELGLEVYVWTVNEPALMQQLIDLEVSGIITDFPERLRPLLDKPDEIG